MRSLVEAKTRWTTTLSHAASLDELRKSVRTTGHESPCISGLRSVSWKIFLLFESTEVTGWSRILSDSRSAYSALREHLLRFIENPDEIGTALDPLDDDVNSPWATLRQDEEIRAEIYQDVERCMPEEDYFRRPETQQVMLDILFVFCKINQDVGYRQGMHEVLAPILWVIEQDAMEEQLQALLPESASDLVMKEALDRSYIEHDAFTLLSLVMRTAKSFYELGELERKTSTLSSKLGTPQQVVSPIVERSKRIHEVYLAQLDPELSKHLTDIEILPQIFLIRWIRLLFGREFPFEDLLCLWDTLLAEDPGLDLVDMVCVAMLLRIRWQLLEANYSVALMLLLKYPAPEPPYGPQSFVDDAIYLRDNFSAAGGAKIISKYGAQSPSLLSPDLRPSTPSGPALRQKLSRSTLPSPVSFLKQQGGVEALFQSATKNVLDRGERLGINQAVRDAVGEVRKNVQGLQASRNNSIRSKPLEGSRWSLDEGKPVRSTSKAIVSKMNTRNQQLARMLDRAMADLRAATVSETNDKEHYIKAMDLAVARVDFVKVYLEDSSMPLQPEPPEPDAASPASPTRDPLGITDGEVPDISTTASPQSETSETVKPLTADVAETKESPDLTNPSSPFPVRSEDGKATARLNTILPAPSQDVPISKSVNESVLATLARPKAPVPTRSTIAQSSFSWMLESESPSTSSAKSSPPTKSSSPFLKSSRKPTSGPNREKAAFLFGEDGAESTSSKLPLADVEGGYKMGEMGRSNGQRR